MSNPPPLPYESMPTPSAADEPFWRAFRFAVIAWSATVLVRHATYWGGIAAGTGIQRFDVRPATFAAIECVLLILILVNAATLRRGWRNHHASLAGLCAAYIAIAIVGLTFDLLPTFAPGMTSLLRTAWAIASRAQVLIVPVMAVVAFGVSKRR